jgi:hypothetical protein
MKLLKKLLILLLGLSIGGIGCKKIEEADPTLGILFSQLVSQVSGACAEVTKYGGTYLARLTPIPKGGCNAETIYAGPDADTFAAQTFEGLKAFLQQMSAISSNCNGVLTAINATPTLQTGIKNTFKDAYNNARDNTKVRFYGIDSIKQEITAYENNPYFNSMKTLSLDGYKKFAPLHGYRVVLAGIYANAPCSFTDANLGGVCGKIKDCVYDIGGNPIGSYFGFNIQQITGGEVFTNHNLQVIPPPPPPPPVPTVTVGLQNIVAGLGAGLTGLFNNYDPFIVSPPPPPFNQNFTTYILWSVVCDYGTGTPLAVNCTKLSEQF